MCGLSGSANHTLPRQASLPKDYILLNKSFRLQSPQTQSHRISGTGTSIRRLGEDFHHEPFPATFRLEHTQHPRSTEAIWYDTWHNWGQCIQLSVSRVILRCTAEL
jgi:hypothetical protein